MNTLGALVGLCLFAVSAAYPYGGHYFGRLYHDPSGNTVPGYGDQNNDQVPDAADTNRDGKVDSVLPYYPPYGLPYGYPAYPYAYYAAPRAVQPAAPFPGVHF